VSEDFVAIVNRAAGGGRCGNLVDAALNRLRDGGLRIEVEETARAGHATRLVRELYARGRRSFIAVGGDGTAYEMVNGLFPEALSGPKPTLGFLPLGTGNSFLRDFSSQALEHAAAALLEGRQREIDVLRLVHSGGTLYYINLLSLGFAADVAMMRHRRFRRLGELGYVLSLFVCLARLRRRPFPLLVDRQGDFDRRPCLFLTFNNSKFTGGSMMIAPMADVGDGLIEYVRWGPIGRLALLRNLHTLYDGTHLNHPRAERRAARQIDFQLEEPVDVMIDGEVLTVRCERIDVLPLALRVAA
jgi:diacylglycerol kinase (ATP)